MSKKGENIYKRKDKRWEARYVKGYRPDGMPKYGYCYGKTYREAKKKATDAKLALLTGRPASTASFKRHFAYYCDEWLRLNRNRIKESTYAKYCGILENMSSPGSAVVLYRPFLRSLLSNSAMSFCAKRNFLRKRSRIF